MSKKYAVVTGASSGIGKSFAEVFAKNGYDLVLIARSEDVMNDIALRLKKEYGVSSVIISADLSDKNEVTRCYDAIKDLDIEYFINNAGFGDAGRFRETDLGKDIRMIDLNVTAVHIFTKRMLGYFVERGSGNLLNVASSAGLMPAGPYMATYYATKAYVASLSKAIARELKEEGKNIYIGALCPGPVDTGFNKAANVEFSLRGISAEDCVNYAFKMMQKKKTVIVPTMTLKLAVFARRLLPDSTTVMLTGRQQKKKIQD